MSETINQIICAANYKNVGTCDCFFDPKEIKGGFLVPIGKVFSPSDLLDAAIQATLEALIHADQPERIYPFPHFVGMTDNSEDAVDVTYGFGGTEKVRDGNYKWSFRFRNGGLSVSNRLRSFNGKQNKYAVIFFDDDNTFIGTKSGTGITGIIMEEIYTKKWKANPGNDTTMYEIMFNFQPEQINEDLAFKKVTNSSYLLRDLNGLLDVTPAQLAVANLTVTVGLTDQCGADMYDEFADEFAVVGAWVLANATTGGAIPVTSVTKNATLKGWVITPTAADPDMPASGSTYTVSLASPTELKALTASIEGYEGASSLTVTRPA